MRQDRRPDEVRPITITPSYNRYAEGSALVHWGHTHVLATVTLDNKLPPHLRGQGHKGGWLTAEYAMLPRSAQQRIQRERLYSGGRTQEIQRLLGRSLRTVLDLRLFPNKTIIIDVDVLQADGGTRCAGVLAAYAALHEAANKLIFKGDIDEWPLTHELAAVSVGLVDGEKRVDLEFSEDSKAELDLNVIATADGKLVEVQGGAESSPVAAETYVQLIASGVSAVQGILSEVKSQLK